MNVVKGAIMPKPSKLDVTEPLGSTTASSTLPRLALPFTIARQCADAIGG
jgi:hypothetical protein